MLNCTSSLETVTRELRAGRPAVFPTDTVCGVGVSVLHAASPEILYTLKRRPPEKPIAWLVAGVSDLEKFGANVPEYAFELAKKYWPGALTLVVRASENVPAAYLNAGNSLCAKAAARQDGLSAKSSSLNSQGGVDEFASALNEAPRFRTIGMRCPSSEIVRQLLHKVGGPLCTTSANFSGDPAPAVIEDLNPAFAKDLPILVAQNDGDKLISAISATRSSGIASTVIDCTGPCPIILRKGLMALEL